MLKLCLLYVKKEYLSINISDLIINVAILFLWTLGVKLCTDAPAASSATMFAEKYDCDAPYVSRLVTVSTILCIATMPLIVMLVQAW